MRLRRPRAGPTRHILGEHCLWYFVRPERTGFDIPDVTDGAPDQDDPSMEDIRETALVAVEQYLHSILAAVWDADRARVEDYVAKKAPRYRPILRHISEDKLSIDPALSDKELEPLLHRYLSDLESELLDESQRMLDAEDTHGQEYSERLHDYLLRVDDIKESDLAAYVSRRRVILDLLAKAVRADRDSKYVKEDVVHTLIMPMRITSDDPPAAASNLWVIDESLAFHDYLASDRPIKSMPIAESLSPLEPDLLALQVHDGPVLVSEGERLPLASIVVVEIKRPMRNDAAPGPEKDPISQALRYLEEVREGKVTTAAGRPIPRSDQIPGFCYVIADLTPTVQERCKQADLLPTPDGLGYFGYNKNYKAYVARPAVAAEGGGDEGGAAAGVHGERDRSEAERLRGVCGEVEVVAVLVRLGVIALLRLDSEADREVDHAPFLS